MAEENLVVPKGDTPPAGFPDAAKHNKEVAEKLAAQDIMGQSTAPDPNADSGSELDKLAQQLEEQRNKPEPETPPAKTEEELAAEQKAADEKSAADKKAEEEKQAAQKKADEYFKDSPTLPPNASPKSSEAFSAIKIKAAQDIADRDARLEKLSKEKAELEQRLQKQAEVPPDALKELEEARKWRAKLDVDADPKFKEYDRRAEAAREFIYAQLLKSPAIDKTVIDEIKKYGGPDKIKMDKLFEAVGDPMIQQLCMTKIADIEMAKYEKTKALAAAKENIEAYVQERAQQFSQQAVQHHQATHKHLIENLNKVGWFATRDVPANADKATREAIEDDNKFVLETREQIQAALKDDSAEMRAVMLTGMAQLFKLQRDLPKVTAERDALKKQVDELETKLTAIKNAGRARIREGGAAPGAAAKIAPKPTEQFNTHTGDALDGIMKQIQEERSRSDSK